MLSDLWQRTAPEPVLSNTDNLTENGLGDNARDGKSTMDGFAGTVVDPARLCLHMLARRGARHVSLSIAAKRRDLIRKALELRPGALRAREKMQLLTDVSGLRILHNKVWELSDGEQARKWGI